MDRKSQFKTAKDASRAAFKERGGRLLQVGLEPEENALLAAVREATGATTDTEAVVAALRLAGAGRVVTAMLTQRESAALSELMKLEGLDERDAIGTAIVGEVTRARRRKA